MPPRGRGNASLRPTALRSKSSLATSLPSDDTDIASSARPSSSSDMSAVEERGTEMSTRSTASSSAAGLILDSTTSSDIKAPEEQGQSLQASSSSSSSASDSDSTPISNLPNASSLYFLHSRSHTYLGPAAFAPPFYNRPPTPLPPSPSLTSLLRPSFSAAPSRRASPDHSSDDAGDTATSQYGPAIPPHPSDTHASSLAPSTRNASQTRSTAVISTLTSSFRTARPVPLASPKVPTYEYYGFTLYLGSSLAFLMYLLWSFLPSPFLHQLGIYYYPNRWWALAVPAWLVVCVVWIFAALAGWNTERETLDLSDLRTLVDDKGQVARVDGQGRRKGTGAAVRERAGAQLFGERDRVSGERDWKVLWSEGTDAVMDIPVGGVCEVLYGQGREDSGPEDDGH